MVACQLKRSDSSTGVRVSRTVVVGLHTGVGDSTGLEVLRTGLGVGLGLHRTEGTLVELLFVPYIAAELDTRDPHTGAEGTLGE